MENSNWKFNPLRTTESRRRKMKTKILIASLVGAASLGMMQTATAADWYGGDCSVADPGVCIEYGPANTLGDFLHIETNRTSGGFVGPIVSGPSSVSPNAPYSGTMDNFRFIGTTDLACFSGTVTASCTLELDGKVSLNGSTVNIDINDGSVTGGGLCSGITVKDFSWYIAPDSSHDTSDFYPGGGIVVSSAPPLVGAVGSIGFTVKDPLFGATLVDITDSHIHGVTFDNNGSSASSFTFANDIYENGTENNTGCSINGALYVADGKDINIKYK